MENSNPNVAQKVDNIYVPNTVQINNARVSASSNQTATSYQTTNYNSSVWKRVINPQNGLTITWHKAAIDKNTGCSMDITWKITNIVSIPNGDSDALLTEANHMKWWKPGANHAEINPDYQPVFIAYGDNPIDELQTQNVASYNVTETLTYSDDNTPYKGVYYRSAGSLNSQRYASRWEFSAPVSGVKATYISNDSWIGPQEQNVSGVASQGTKKAFMLNGREQHMISDNTPEALTKLGVTYLVNNDSTIAYGISGQPNTGKNPEASLNGNEGTPNWDQENKYGYAISSGNGGNNINTHNAWAFPWQMHLMGAMQTIANVIPKPESSVRYHYNQAENRYYDSRIIFSIIFWLSLSANSLTMCTYVCCVVIVLA